MRDPVHLTLITRDVLGTLLLLCLTLSRAAPLAVSKVRGGGHICPPQVSEGAGGLWFQIFVATLYLTQIDTRKKDLPFSDA